MTATVLRTTTEPWYLESSERFRFMLILALVIHALVILAINFQLPDMQKPAQTLEITLARFDDQKAPAQADFLAQTNQQGSGEALDKRQPSTRERALFAAEQAQQQAAKAAQIMSEPAQIQPVEVSDTNTNEDVLSEQERSQGFQASITSDSSSLWQATQLEQQQARSAPPPMAGISTSLIAQTTEIASLQAKLMFEQEKMAKRPKVTRVTSASTRAHKDADYLEDWRQRIEMLGNLHYPEEARKRAIYGSLRMLVSIHPDGSIKEVDILKSSGHSVLDDAAIQIVKLAAPFPPFPIEMRERTDVLEIIRTWKFEKEAQIY